MTNKERGEHQIDLGEVKLTLKPTYENFAKIEALLNMSVMDICYKCNNANLQMTELVPVIEILSGEKDLGQAVMDFGYVNILPELGIFLVKAISGNAPTGGKVGGK